MSEPTVEEVLPDNAEQERADDPRPPDPPAASPGRANR